MYYTINELNNPNILPMAVDELTYISYASNRDNGCTAETLKKAGFPMADLCEKRYMEEKEND